MRCLSRRCYFSQSSEINSTFKLNVMWPSRARVMRRKFGSVMFVAGLPRLARLRALKKFTRSSKLRVSVDANFFCNPKSSETTAGPRRFGVWCRLTCLFALALYALLKIESLTVPVLSENDSCSIPSERRTLRCTFDIRVSPLRQ